MARVILTYSRGWHSLAICRSLGRQGIEVYCGEESPFAPCFFSKYCTGHFQYPSVSDDPDAFIEVLLEKVKELKPPADEPYVLMPVHKETWLIAARRELFEPHISVPLTSYENMVRTHDKGKLALLAEKLDIAIPGTRQFRSLDDVYRGIPAMQFPVFLKMRAAAAGVGLKKCKTPEELTASFRQFVDGYELQPEDYPLVQDFIPGEDYCHTALYNHGEQIACMTYHNIRYFWMPFRTVRDEHMPYRGVCLSCANARKKGEPPNTVRHDSC
jgi:predicted ATP-grasp superfamily ATP-dependent carboligase